MNTSRKPHGDDGVSLVLVLVFMLVVSLFVTVALTKSISTTTSGIALRERGAIQYALDGGIERGLEAVRDSTRSPGASGVLCATAGSSQSIPGSPMSINGHEISVTCENLGGSVISGSSLTTNYAIILLSTAGDALATSGAVASVPASPCDDPAPAGGYLRLKASLYLAGPQSNSAVDPPLVVCEGHVVQYAGAPCTDSSIADLSNLRVVTASYVRSCTDQTPAQAMPAFASLPARPSPDPDVSGCYVDISSAGVIRRSPCSTPPISSGGPVACRIYFPGRYEAAPDLQSDNYFASGTYWFEDIGEFSVGASQQVIVGRKVMSNDQGLEASATNCDGASDTLATSLAPLTGGVDLATSIDPSGGAQWIFDGDSQLGVSGDLTVHARPYTSPNPPFTFVAGGYSPWVQGPGSTTGGGASCSTGFALCNSSGGSRMVINGRVYAPTAPAQLFATGGTENVVTGGAALWSLKLGASVAGGALAVSGPGGAPLTPPPFRTVRITASTVGTSETTRAVATVGNFSPSYTTSVKSWRTG